MYELVQAGERTWYINCPAKIGVYRTADNEVVLIDSGNDKEAAKKVLKIIEQNNWKLKGIVNTHSNADHIGGNATLQQRTGCAAGGTGLENAFIRYPQLEPSFLYGGYPCKELRNKFLLATPSEPSWDSDSTTIEGLTFFRLGGHFFDMIGVKTSDDVCFLADSVFSPHILEKYHIIFLYDVQAFLDTLDGLEQLQGKLFIPSHADAMVNISTLTQANRDKIMEIRHFLLEICSVGLIFEDILHRVFTHYGLTMDFNQYVLVGSTIRSYLSWLYDGGQLTCGFEENYLRWKTK
jgi:glyoxylase-like metal-dependent hydrolase (beta-lactamase superfamily II)